MRGTPMPWCRINGGQWHSATFDDQDGEIRAAIEPGASLLNLVGKPVNVELFVPRQGGMHAGQMTLMSITIDSGVDDQEWATWARLSYEAPLSLLRVEVTPRA